MSTLPEPILNLVLALNKLPGIGPRSAERIALFLAQTETQEARRLADAIVCARERVSACEVCGALTEKQPCALCESPSRDRSVLCVVERAVDVYAVEKAGSFKGLYHVLGGRLSPINGVEPDDLRIPQLERRTQDPQIREVIVALNMDVEGDATAFYLAKRLHRPGLSVTRLAQGLPSGTGIEFTDQLTLSRALEGRRTLPSE